MKRYFLVMVLLSSLFIVACSTEEEITVEVSNFDECVAAGYPVMESYPRQCRDSIGDIYEEETFDVEPVVEERDEHGCLISEDYKWCPSQERCVLTWDELCEEYPEDLKD